MARRLSNVLISSRHNVSSAAIGLAVVALMHVGCAGTPADSNVANGGTLNATSGNEERGGQTASTSSARARGGSENSQIKGEGGASGSNKSSGKTTASGGRTSGASEAGASGEAAESGGAEASGGTNSRTKASKPTTGGSSAGSKSATGGASAKNSSGGTSAGPKSSSGGTGGSSKSGAGGAVGKGGSDAQVAGGTGGATEPSTSTGFNPCPTNGDPCKILPLGDSITYGMASSDNGGYRVPLFKKAVAASQKITFTGTVMAGPSTVSNVTFPKNNEGHSGWTIDQIAGLVPSPAFNTVPHIVLLMGGTNDVYAASGQATMQDRLGTLIDKTVTAAPNALIVVATITPLSIGNYASTINTYNGKIPDLVQKRASAGKHVVMVDMSKLPTNQLADGVHPNDAGYSYMADVWYAAIKDLLPK
ncbi:MAG: GDSL-type esterase/lipase family protein [Myxococcales bacterium]